VPRRWPPTGAALQLQLATAHRIEVPVVAWGGRAYVRLSAQVYNRIEDYDRLAHALARELAA
jgi:isopenicillin-N epimerase